MVSLTAVEALAGRVWADAQHAAVAVPDERKGEQIVLMTTQKDAERHTIVQQAQRDNISELIVPRTVMPVVSVPVLGTGKTDYITAQSIVEEQK